MRPCNLCGSEEISEYLRIRVNGLLALKCSRCSLIYIGNNPVADNDLPKLYTMDAYRGERHLQSSEWYKDYYKDCLKGYNHNSPVIGQFKRNLDIISRYAPGRRLLDVGCATGVFLDVARARGYDVVGTDVSEDMVHYARAEFSIDAHLGPLDKHRFPAASFDCVTLLDVIEHIPSYSELMGEISRILKPGGIILLRTPTEDAFMRSLAKLIHAASFGHIEGPLLWFYSFEHVTSFSGRTLSKLVEDHGFKVVHMHDECEAPERLNVPLFVKWGLAAFESVAGLFSRRHKIVLVARVP